MDSESKDTKQYDIIHFLMSNLINDHGMHILISGYRRENTATQLMESNIQ